MAANTMNASAALSGVQPRYAAQGIVAIYSEYTLTATLSTADIIEICKIPDGARIVDIQFNIPNTVHDNCKINIGIPSDHDKFVASLALSTALITNLAENGVVAEVGTILNTSDSASTKYTMLRAKVSDGGASSGTGTNAGTFKFLVSYYNPAPY